MQTVALNNKLPRLEMQVACHGKLTALGHDVQMHVLRRWSLETVLLLGLQTRCAETPADVGEETPFMPNLRSQGHQTAPPTVLGGGDD